MQETLTAPSMAETQGLAPRICALALALACASPLIVGAMLTPNADGMGTHTQMGLPQCGFVLATGYPCATCGCTTSFAYMADGSLLTAFITQPFGALLALALAMMTLISLWSAVSGMRLEPLGKVMGTKKFIFFWVGLLLVSWAYKSAVVAMGS